MTLEAPQLCLHPRFAGLSLLRGRYAAEHRLLLPCSYFDGCERRARSLRYVLPSRHGCWLPIWSNCTVIRVVGGLRVNIVRYQAISGSGACIDE